MSFEGYYQLICANGHARAHDVYDDRSETCCCGAEWALENTVDETNGCDGDPCMCGARELVEIEPAQVEVCNLGHSHEIKEARYTFGEVKKHTCRCSWGDGYTHTVSPACLKD